MRSRRLAFVALGLLLGACKARIAVGEKCERGEEGQFVGCIDPTTAAQCVDNRLRAFACRGALGCKAGERSASCDRGIGRVGDPCWAAVSRELAICSEDKKSELVCKSERKLELGWLCRGAKGCDPAQLPDYPMACDRTIARVGDPCRRDSLRTDEHGACTEDAKTLLSCDAASSTFKVDHVCSSAGACKVIDMLPRCVGE